MGFDTKNRLPDAVLDVLKNADRFELFSLDPTVGSSREVSLFHHWRVLGSVVIELMETRREVLAALELGIAENTGWVAACFIPRHGVHAVRDSASVDLVVCFECSQIHVHTDGRWTGSVLVSGSPQPIFDRVLSASGIPLAAKLDFPRDGADPIIAAAPGSA